MEDGTPLAEDTELLAKLPDEETDREMYEATRKVLEMSGYKRYEISNYAKPGYECRHNIVYWTMDEYIGLVSVRLLFLMEEDTQIHWI